MSCEGLVAPLAGGAEGRPKTKKKRAKGPPWYEDDDHQEAEAARGGEPTRKVRFGDEEKPEANRNARARSQQGARTEEVYRRLEESLVTPLAFGASRNRSLPLAARPEAGGAGYAASLERMRANYAMAKLADGTRSSYDRYWGRWVVYRLRQDMDPWLRSRTREERIWDEDCLIDYCTFLAGVLGQQGGTVKTSLFAIRYRHLVQGFLGPLLHRQRLWGVIAGIERLSRKILRKHPVTTRMLLWLREWLLDSGYSVSDVVVLWAALAPALFYLLRVSEYLVQLEKTWSWDRVLHGDDVVPQLNGTPVRSFCDAEEVAVYIKGSKTDQYNQGCVRNHHRGSSELCPVAAWEEYEQHYPERLHGSERHLPIFRFADGRPVSREHIQRLLRLAAHACSVAPENISSHSLRSGGATAMFHVRRDLEVVKRYGRWVSDAFHAYLWESASQTRGLAAKMAEDDATMVAPK